MANKKVSQLVSKPSVLVTDLFPIADPTTGQLFKTTISDLGTAIGSGVSSVNTLVGAVVLDTDDIQELASPTNRWFTDTRARAALSASSPLAYNSGTGVFSIPAATSSQDGYLTSTDWATFNAKQPALSGTGFVKISGTTISYDNSIYLTTSAAASTYLALAGGTLTGALNGTSATFTGDLTLSATNPRLYFTDTDNNPDYFISNTDGTFTIYDVTNSTSRLTLTNLYTTLNNTVKIQGDILLNQDSTIGPVTGYTTIASDSSGIFLRLGTATSHAYLVLSSLTSYRNFTLPDATGTLALTSQLSSYLPLSGGTLTSALSGTSATFSGQVNAASKYTWGSATTGTTGQIATDGTNNYFDYIGSLIFRGAAASNTLVTFTNTGAATFSSSVTANGLIRSNSGIFQIFVADVFRGGLYNYASASGSGTDYSPTLLSETNLYFTTGGVATPKMVINSSGNVGIGTTAPSALLHVNSATTATQTIAKFAATNYASASSKTYIQLGTQYDDGSSRIGSSNPSGNLSELFFETATATSGVFAERMRITSGGDVLVGQTTSSLADTGWNCSGNGGGHTVFAINNNEAFTFNNLNTGTNYQIDFRTNSVERGSINVTDSSTSYSTTSDYRIKEDFKSIKGLELVSKIKVYDFKFKDMDARMDGVIAHELQEILPYAVHGIKDGEKLQQVDYSKIVPVMVQAIKELKAELDTLKNK